MDGRGSQSLSTPPLMGADSAIHQLIYIHGAVPELAVKCRALFYLCKSPTLSLSSSPQLKMSLAFCVAFWRTVGGFLYVYTAEVWCCAAEWTMPPGVLTGNLTDTIYRSCATMLSVWSMLPSDKVKLHNTDPLDCCCDATAKREPQHQFCTCMHTDIIPLLYTEDACLDCQFMEKKGVSIKENPWPLCHQPWQLSTD